MEINAYIQFGEWLKKQPCWLQDATWRIYNNQKIDDQQVSAYVQMCIDEVQKRNIVHKRIDEQQLGSSTDKTKMTIVSINNVSNVNALADNAELSFGESGVSVVYGLNGAGKSGFMRIFKHVTGNPYAEVIQKNVYKKSSGNNPSCVFNIIVDSKKESIPCDLSSNNSNPNLSQCDVFDTRISGAYITSSNSVSYEPFVFSVLRELADIASRIEFAIKERIAIIPESVIKIPGDLSHNDKIDWLTTISDKTIIPSECLSWEETDEKRVAELNKLLDITQVENAIKSFGNQKHQLKSVLDDMLQLKTALLGNDRVELIIAYDDYVAKKEQFELAQRLFSENAYEQDKISVSVEAWTSLWKHGKSYYESCLHEINKNSFAKEGSICPLCLQEVKGDVLARFSSVDEYVNGSCNKDYQEAKKTFEEKLHKILEHTLSSTIVANMLQELFEKDFLEEIVNFYKLIEQWTLSEDTSSVYFEIKSIDAIEIINKVESVVNGLVSKISDLKENLNIEKRKELQKELEDRQYRKWVNSQIEVINALINNEKKKVELNEAKALLKTNRISNESNTLAEQLISEAYIERFSNELRKLAPYLKVKLEKAQSSKGKSPYKVVLDTEDKARKYPQDILSEGEQRIVALAAFFADATGRDELTPIVIDDPISSLDYNYEEAATKRIVELAKVRQVIVFTHRISLLVGISEQCEKENVEFSERHIRGTLTGKGVSDFEETYHGKVAQQLNGLLERIRETKKMDPFSREYADSCSRISQQLRICVERSVEDVLFQQMVKRFSRRIMTGKLMKMDRITSTDCKIIDNMMTKYSYGEHSQPEDSGLISMNLDDVISDIDNFIAWIRDYIKRMEAK